MCKLKIESYIMEVCVVQTKRYYVKTTDTIASFFEERARLTGQSMSAVLSMALAEYVESKKGLEALTKLMNEHEK